MKKFAVAFTDLRTNELSIEVIEANSRVEAIIIKLDLLNYDTDEYKGSTTKELQEKAFDLDICIEAIEV